MKEEESIFLEKETHATDLEKICFRTGFFVPFEILRKEKYAEKSFKFLATNPRDQSNKCRDNKLSTISPWRR